jgi:TfoX/Sxy family transcriptional regulator of competence genes
MAYNEKLTARVREALAHIPDVVEKRMFRGALFMVNGKMCLTTGDDRLMCRIDPELHAEAVKKEGVKPVLMKGKEYKGYVHVNEEVLKTKKQFDYWIGLALDFNERAKASKPKKKKAAKK